MIWDVGLNIIRPCAYMSTNINILNIDCNKVLHICLQMCHYKRSLCPTVSKLWLKIRFVAGGEALWFPQRGKGVGGRVALRTNKGGSTRNMSVGLREFFI